MYRSRLLTVLTGVLCCAAFAGAVEYPAANPSATPRARAILHYLYEITGKGIVAGVHGENWDPDRMPNKMYEQTGKWVGYYDNDFRYGNNLESNRRQSVAEVKKKYLEEKTIVGMMWHMTRPMDPETEGFSSSVQGNITSQDMDNLLKAGTDLNKKWIARLDLIAGYLRELRDAGVPVIWRPYHEMNGGWFWWGKQPRFKELWIQMYDRYVNYHKLNNLIWMWCPNCVVYDAGQLADYYPGHKYVDVLASDIYANKSYDWEQRFHDDLLALGEGRPIAMGEVGDMPDPAFLKEKQPKWTLFLLWSGYEGQYANNPERNKYVFNHSFTITRDELPASVFSVSTTTVMPDVYTVDGGRVKNVARAVSFDLSGRVGAGAFAASTALVRRTVSGTVAITRINESQH